VTEETLPADAAIALEKLWTLAGCEPAALERVTLTGADPILPTDFKIGTAASAVIAAGALAASEIWRLRTGRGQSVAVDLRAAVAAFRSERYLRAESQPDLLLPRSHLRLLPGRATGAGSRSIPTCRITTRGR